jgi:hypothetical protein
MQKALINTTNSRVTWLENFLGAIPLVPAKTIVRVR